MAAWQAFAFHRCVVNWRTAACAALGFENVGELRGLVGFCCPARGGQGLASAVFLKLGHKKAR
jgi:hypothetical protein